MTFWYPQYSGLWSRECTWLSSKRRMLYRHYLSQSSRNCEQLTRTALIGELWLVEKRFPINTFSISIFLAGHVLNANGGESILIIRNSLFVSPTRSSNKQFKYNYLEQCPAFLTKMQVHSCQMHSITTHRKKIVRLIWWIFVIEFSVFKSVRELFVHFITLREIKLF